MLTIFERVTTALNTLSPSVPFALAPYASTGSLPDLYLAYQLIDGNAAQHADNLETQRSYLVQISIFSVSGLVGLPDVNSVMLAAGFEKSTERQIPKDPQSGHFGLAKDFTYIEDIS